MRTILKWVALPALLVAVACQDRKADDDLASDLALVTGPDIELANGGGAGTMVVSAVENIPAPSPRSTPSPSKKRGTKAPPPDVSIVEVGATESETTAPEMVTVSPSENPVAAEIPAPEAPPVIRPQPIEPRYPVGDGSIYGSGRDEGRGTGGVTVVIRGGRTGRDPCAIHDSRGRGPGVSIMINNRIPTGSTFPRR